MPRSLSASSLSSAIELASSSSNSTFRERPIRNIPPEQRRQAIRPLNIILIQRDNFILDDGSMASMASGGYEVYQSTANSSQHLAEESYSNASANPFFLGFNSHQSGDIQPVNRVRGARPLLMRFGSSQNINQQLQTMLEPQLGQVVEEENKIPEVEVSHQSISSDSCESFESLDSASSTTEYNEAEQNFTEENPLKVIIQPSIDLHLPKGRVEMNLSSGDTSPSEQKTILANQKRISIVVNKHQFDETNLNSASTCGRTNDEAFSPFVNLLDCQEYDSRID